MLMQKLLASAGGNEKLFVDDCFACHTYTGNGSTQTITNGIDLAGKGGMVWIKDRGNAQSNALIRNTGGNYLSSDSTAAESSTGALSFSSTGFGLPASTLINGSPRSFVSWTFRKAPKFFDVVTYTGNGTTQNIAHSLGQVPGMVIVKRTDGVTDWLVWHRGMSAGSVMSLNATAAQSASFSANWFGNNTTYVDPTASQFTVGSAGSSNASGGTYVAYLFAHDTGTDGLIQCGSAYKDTATKEVNLGWEPQYILIKTTAGTDGWHIYDASRKLVSSVGDARLLANSSDTEDNFGSIFITATGFTLASGFSNTQTYIYLAIRRPNKPPTVGTQVYNAIARTGTGAAATVTGVGFAPDLVIHKSRAAYIDTHLIDRLRGGSTSFFLATPSTAEATDQYPLILDASDGFKVPALGTLNNSGSTYITHLFKRAPGVMDIVCFSGDNGTTKTVTHNLSVAPELVLLCTRNFGQAYQVGASIGSLYLTISTGANQSGNFASIFLALTSSSFTTAGPDWAQNVTGRNYVAYLFATKAGISKVGSYTGNGGTAGSAGASQTINCGFTTGSRFVMLKCTSHTSDWVVVDTVRGLIAGSDPALSLNTTAAEVTTTDLLDPDNSGFVVNQLATGTTSADFNVTGRTYLYLSFA